MSRGFGILILITTILLPAYADLYTEAELLFDEGKYAESAERYEEFLKHSPKSVLVPAALFALSWTYLHAENADSALDALSRIEASGENGRAPDLFLYTTGAAYELKEEDAQAVYHLERVRDEYPKSPLISDAHRLLAEVRARQKSYDEALAALDRLEAAEIHDEDLARRYEIHLKRRDYENALATLKRRIPLAGNPEVRADLTFEKARIEERLDRSNRETLEQYLRMAPQGSHAARVHRMVAEQEADLVKRTYHYMAAVTLGDVEPFAAENRLALAETLRATGDEAGAIEQWKLLLSDHVASSEAKAALKLLRAQPAELIGRDNAFIEKLDLMVQTDADRLIELELFWPIAEASATWRGWKKPAITVEGVIADLVSGQPAPGAIDQLQVILPPSPPPAEEKLRIPAGLAAIRILIAPPDFGRGLELMRPLPFWIRDRLSQIRRVSVVAEEQWWAYQNGGDVADFVLDIEADRPSGLVWVRYTIPSTGVSIVREYTVKNWKEIPYDALVEEVVREVRGAM